MSKTNKISLSINTDDKVPIDENEFKDIRQEIARELPVFDEERSLTEPGYYDKYFNKIILVAYKEGLRRGARNVENPFSSTYKKLSKRGGKRRTIKSKSRRF